MSDFNQWVKVVEAGELTAQQAKDIELLKRFFAELEDGYSMSLARRRVKLSDEYFRGLKKEYPSLTDSLKKYWQHAKQKAPHG